MRNLTGYVFAAVAKIISLVLQFLLIFVLSNFVGLEAVGFFGPFLAFCLVCGILMNKGQAARAYMEIPLLVHSNELAKAHLRARVLLLCNFRFAIVVAPVVTFVGWVYWLDFKLAVQATLVAACFSLLESLSAILRCLNNIAGAEFVRNGAWRSVVIALIGGFSVASAQLSGAEVAPLMVASTTLSAVLTIVVLRLFPSGRAWEGERQTDWQNWMIQALQALILNLDVMLVGALFGVREAAVYFIGARLASLVALPLSVTNPVITPSYSRLARGSGDPRLRRRIRLNTAINLTASLTIFIGVLISGEALARFIAGEDIDAWHILFVLSLGQLVNALVGPSMQVAQLFGIRQPSIFLQICAAVLILVAAAASASLQSIIVLAVGVALARLFVNIGIAWLMLRRAHLNIFSGAKTTAPG